MQKVKVAKRCGNCMYANYYSLYDKYNCRRYPPKVSSLTTNCSDFPMVNVNDWCGEFKEKSNDDMGSI